MQLLFLGTAAAEGYPGLFCNCPNCQEARALGGRNLRMRSALLVNDDLLIDFGPDLLASAHKFGRSLHGVRTGLVTHAHMDHFFIGNFEMRGDSFTGRLPIPLMRLFGPQEATDSIQQALPDLEKVSLELHTVRAFETWTDGPYTFRSYQAYHAVGHLDAVFYSVDDGQHSFLYATDTGPFPEATWKALEGQSFDVIILEETLGTGNYTQHMGFNTFIDHVRRMRDEGMLRPGGRIIAHHMSHTSNPVHEKVEAILGPHGVDVAYDGMEIKL